ncbi:MAG: hypothetical protein AAF664_11575 [Planctomycetota bacterium]
MSSSEEPHPFSQSASDAIEADLAESRMNEPITTHDVEKSKQRKIGSNQELLRRKWVTLGILFGVTGALGIPLLWQNPRFSHFERVIWSVAVLVYTFALLGVTYAILKWAWNSLSGAGYVA